MSIAVYIQVAGIDIVRSLNTWDFLQLHSVVVICVCVWVHKIVCVCVCVCVCMCVCMYTMSCV